MKHLINLLCLLLLVTSPILAQKTTSNPNIAKVENGLSTNGAVVFADSTMPVNNIYDRMKWYKVPSVSIAVINNGKIEWAKAYGLADVQENRPADVNTVYQAASISKSLNAFYVMLLVQNKKLSLDADIRQYLKTWTFPDDSFSQNKTITLRNLLSHTAGLSTHGFMGYVKGDSLPSTNAILNGTRPANSEAVKPIMAPGRQVSYSGGGTVIIKKILDDNIGNDYASLLQQNVLQPLGMRNSTFVQPLPASITNYATAYNGNGKEEPGKFYVYPELAPDGLWTTATDLARFVISLQQSLQNKPALLSNATAKEMCTPVLGNAALGCFIEERDGEKYFTHGGANIGYRSNYYGSFTTGTGVAILTNSDNGQSLMQEIINSVAAVYNWKGFKPATRKLVAMPDSLIDKYAGEYINTNPAMTITITKKDGGLQLSVHGTEKMYFVSPQRFFLLSDPDTYGEFIVGPNGAVKALAAKRGNETLFTATKK